MVSSFRIHGWGHEAAVIAVRQLRVQGGLTGGARARPLAETEALGFDVQGLTECSGTRLGPLRPCSSPGVEGPGGRPAASHTDEQHH